jgi:DNA repair protein RadC
MDIILSESDRIKVLNSDDLFQIMQKVLLRENKIDQNREHFWTVGLENNNRILFIELICLGSVNKTIAEPMEVFSLALQRRAVKIILVHNHPTGELKPSEEDKDVTDRLIQVGIIVDTPVLDHLIISEKSYLSFLDIGLMEELKKSTKYVPAYQLQAKMKKESFADGEESGLKKGKKEMALLMKQMGEPVEKIVAYTGLTEGEIKRLK